MDGDRAAALIKQAAFTGLVDFSKARLSDRSWWIRLKWLLDELETHNVTKIHGMHFELNTALLDYKNDENQFTHHWDRSIEMINRVYNELFPWDKQAVDKKTIQKTYENLANQWKEQFGDPDDPEVAKKIQNTVDALLGKVDTWQNTTTPLQATRRNIRGS